MEEKLDSAIEKVLGLIRTNMNPDEAQKITQAVQEKKILLICL